jgi:hypothetical protein
MRNLVLPALIGTGLLAGATGALAGAGPFDTKSNGVLTVAVYGDSPYGGSPTDDSQTLATPAFIDSINADPNVSLVLHVGDIHSGKQFCTEAYDETIYHLWTRFEDPLVYTPGDNEWTDCHKTGEGGGSYNKTTGQIDYVRDASGNPVDYASGDPIANLGLIRSIFFANPGHALADRKIVLSQSQAFDSAHPSDAKFVENVMWEQSKVVFVTIDLPGGSNNDTDIWYGTPTMSAAQQQEISERTGADLRWLDAAFARASADGARGVVIMAQADMWDPEKGASHLTAFEPYIQNIAAHTSALGRPVLMFNGDSHVYQTGNPLDPSDPVYAMHPNYNVPNFHRVVVHGSTTPLEWLALTIDPGANAPQSSNAFGPFRWTEVVP